jgi:gamma-glutamylcyclotransferase (GGCT)/AIG2-like uncharacterized protein YtfP
VQQVFVYGTLMPGDCRWPLIADDVVALRRAEVPGRLFDTGRDYPGARFELDGAIHGWVLELRSTSSEQTIERLDEIEGTVHGNYRRVEVTTVIGDRCWAYQIETSVAGLRDLNGVWPIDR